MDTSGYLGTLAQLLAAGLDDRFVVLTTAVSLQRVVDEDQGGGLASGLRVELGTACLEGLAPSVLAELVAAVRERRTWGAGR